MSGKEYPDSVPGYMIPLYEGFAELRQMIVDFRGEADEIKTEVRHHREETLVRFKEVHERLNNPDGRVHLTTSEIASVRAWLGRTKWAAAAIIAIFGPFLAALIYQIVRGW